MVTRPIFLLFMFISLFFKTIYAPVCHFFWKTLSGTRLGMEPSTKYQKHSPGIILSATLTRGPFVIIICAILRLVSAGIKSRASKYKSSLVKGRPTQNEDCINLYDSCTWHGMPRFGQCTIGSTLSWRISLLQLQWRMLPTRRVPTRVKYFYF